MPVAPGVCLRQSCGSLPAAHLREALPSHGPRLQCSPQPPAGSSSAGSSEAASGLARGPAPHPSAHTRGTARKRLPPWDPTQTALPGDLSLHRCSLTPCPPDAQVSPQPPSRQCPRPQVPHLVHGRHLSAFVQQQLHHFDAPHLGGLYQRGLAVLWAHAQEFARLRVLLPNVPRHRHARAGFSGLTLEPVYVNDVPKKTEL